MFYSYLKAETFVQQGCFFFHHFLATSMTNRAQLFTDLVLYADVGIHQVRRLVFDNYQTFPVPLREKYNNFLKQIYPIRPRFGVLIYIGLIGINVFLILCISGCVCLASPGRPRSAPVRSNSFDGAHPGQPPVPCLWSGSLGGDLR